jgi:hypothetical protein
VEGFISDVQGIGAAAPDFNRELRLRRALPVG